MKPLIQYSLPVKGLRKGTHQFDFQIDSAFFKHFEGAPVSDGNIELTLLFDKRPNLYVLDFQFSGTLKTECDRCLAWIDLPVSGEQRLMVKFSTEADKESEEADVVYVDPETQHFNVAKYVYEYIILAMPISKVYDCENDEAAVCNQEMLQYLQPENGSAASETDSEEQADNPIWAELKKLKVKDQ